MTRFVCILLDSVVSVSSSTTALADLLYNLNVQVIQVCNDTGLECTPLGPTGGAATGYLYQSQVQEIWAQADLQVTILPVIQWNNTEGQRLTATERAAVYGNTFTAGTGAALPALGTDTVQVFFVKDHPGTLYDGTASSGYVGNPYPMFEARNAGNAQLYIDGTFASNGRSVIANEGFASDSLSGTLAHEIGHLMGARHVDDVNAGAGAGTVQDPNYGPVPMTSPAGSGGPSYNGSLNNDPTLTVLQENFFLNSSQTAAAIYNGSRLDPDGNATGVVQAIPEPSAANLLSACGSLAVVWAWGLSLGSGIARRVVRLSHLS